MFTYGHWQCAFEFDPDEWEGFTYRIHDTISGREYLGKKLFHKTTKKKVVGKTRRKHIVSDSDWRTYSGSCKELKEVIKEQGEDTFIFTIESLHENRSSLAYREVEMQIFEHVMYSVLPNGVKKFFNGYITPLKFICKPPSEREIQFRVKTYNVHIEDKNYGEPNPNPESTERPV